MKRTHLVFRRMLENVFYVLLAQLLANSIMPVFKAKLVDGGIIVVVYLKASISFRICIYIWGKVGNGKATRP